eukprot:TRINITY_DN3498_c0_g1_i1.p1 TRINITY_DN3498_c0_g1~~TRINITY_DN3498_c0_g1_i1.p1  ORF type:complete len:609 (-),score=125.03 TRINITY_DN3498_c0_g1_i1:4-1830(-)
MVCGARGASVWAALAFLLLVLPGTRGNIPTQSLLQEQWGWDFRGSHSAKEWAKEHRCCEPAACAHPKPPFPERCYEVELKPRAIGVPISGKGMKPVAEEEQVENEWSETTGGDSETQGTGETSSSSSSSTTGAPSTSSSSSGPSSSSVETAPSSSSVTSGSESDSGTGTHVGGQTSSTSTASSTDLRTSSFGPDGESFSASDEKTTQSSTSSTSDASDTSDTSSTSKRSTRTTGEEEGEEEEKEEEEELQRSGGWGESHDPGKVGGSTKGTSSDDSSTSGSTRSSDSTDSTTDTTSKKRSTRGGSSTSNWDEDNVIPPSSRSRVRRGSDSFVTGSSHTTDSFSSDKQGGSAFDTERSRFQENQRHVEEDYEKRYHSGIHQAVSGGGGGGGSGCDPVACAECMVVVDRVLAVTPDAVGAGDTELVRRRIEAVCPGVSGITEQQCQSIIDARKGCLFDAVMGGADAAQMYISVCQCPATTSTSSTRQWRFRRPKTVLKRTVCPTQSKTKVCFKMRVRKSSCVQCTEECEDHKVQCKSTCKKSCVCASPDEYECEDKTKPPAAPPKNAQSPINPKKPPVAIPPVPKVKDVAAQAKAGLLGKMGSVGKKMGL